MTTFNITVIKPKSCIKSAAGVSITQAFTEIRDSLSWALSALGHEVSITDNWIDRHATNIVLGAEHLAPNQPEMFPPGTIIYNLEQPSHPHFAKVQSIATATKCILWDYSLGNVKKHAEAGLYARHVPIGYTPNLTRIPRAETQDIDVLLYGWLTPRRLKIVQELRDAGLHVVATDKCYGGGRDQLISRAKIVLNVHHDGREMFEIVRCSYLMANGKCVVTEESSDEDEYQDLNLCMSRGRWPVDACIALLLDEETRQKFEWRSAQIFKARDYTETIRAALSQPSPSDLVAHRYSAGCRDGDMKDFLPWLREHAKGTILEIGVRDGASTSAFLSGLEVNGGVLLSVDIADCSSLFVGHPQWKFIQSSSQNPKLHVPELDILFVDGCHTREGYRADLERFYPLVKPGGLILSHDIAPNPSITLEATGQADRPSKFLRDEYFAFAEAHSLEHYQLPGENGMGVMVKPIAVDSDESWQASEALAAQ